MSTLLQQAVDRLLAARLDAVEVRYDENDVALYALGIGAPDDPFDQDELKFVYERSRLGFEVIPTFAACFGIGLLGELISDALADLNGQPRIRLHGEQEMAFYRALPTSGALNVSLRVSNVYDKGSGMLINVDCDSHTQAGEALASARYGIFMPGLGGYGGERGTSKRVDLPERPPDCMREEKTLESQALLYRLSGDLTPFHADPEAAVIANFEKPILHGLCTYGFAARALLKHCCGNDAARLAAISARFSRHVFPGETLRTEIWLLDDGQVRFRTKALERDEVVLSRGQARVRD